MNKATQHERNILATRKKVEILAEREKLFKMPADKILIQTILAQQQQFTKKDLEQQRNCMQAIMDKNDSPDQGDSSHGRQHTPGSFPISTLSVRNCQCSSDFATIFRETSKGSRRMW